MIDWIVECLGVGVGFVFAISSILIASAPILIIIFGICLVVDMFSKKEAK